MVKMLMLFAKPMNEQLQVSSISSTTLITQHDSTTDITNQPQWGFSLHRWKSADLFAENSMSSL